jgi:hypothetical protein
MDAPQPSLTGLPSLLVRATLAALAVAAVFAAGMLAITLDILAWAAEDVIVTDALADTAPASADIEVPVRMATMLVWLLAGGLWAAWFAQALTAVARLGPLRAPAGLSVGLLFVPIVNWVAGKRGVNDICRLTATSGAGRPGPVVQAWWAITILFTVAMGTALAMTPPPTEYIEDQVPAYRADAVAYGLAVVAATLGALATRRLSRRVAAACAVAPQQAALIVPPPADVAARRAPLAVRAATWGAWGSAALAAGYLVLTAAVWLSDPDPSALAAIELGVGGPLVLALFVPLVLWLLWYHAAVAAHRLAHGGPSAGWAIAAWFIPPVFLWIPWRILGRLIADVPDGAAARPALHRAWAAWGLSLVYLVPATIAGGTTGAVQDLATWRWYAPLTALAYALTALSAHALVAVTRVAASRDRPPG